MVCESIYKDELAMIGLIAAVSKNGVIGSNNTIPWHCSEDLQFFKRVTTGANVIMGRNTYLSLGRLLPNRTNIIVSRTWDPDETPANMIVTDSIEKAIEIQSLDSNYKDAWIIGGSQIYKESLEKGIPDELLISRMNFEADGDILFPSIPKNYVVTDIMNVSPDFSVYRYNRLQTEK